MISKDRNFTTMTTLGGSGKPTGVVGGTSSNTVGSGTNMQTMRYNSEELRNMASYLDSHVDTGFISDINDRLTRILQIWSGPAAQEFADKIKVMANHLQNMKSSLYEEVSYELKVASENLETATNNIIAGINKF